MSCEPTSADRAKTGKAMQMRPSKAVNRWSRIGHSVHENSRRPTRRRDFRYAGKVAGRVILAAGALVLAAAVPGLAGDRVPALVEERPVPCEVWGWGDNSCGQLGDGASDNERHTPVRVASTNGEGYLQGVVQVAAGCDHSVALRDNGTVWAWGDNWAGRLGDGTEALDRHRPVQVVGSRGRGHLEKVVAAAAHYHSLAVREDGTVCAWGFNWMGRLGDGTWDNKRPSPVRVLALGGTEPLGEIVTVAAGMGHSLALSKSGAVWGWGCNASGQCGNIGCGSAPDLGIPRQVVGRFGSDHLERIADVDAGMAHSVALRNDGTVWAWGGNSWGQLGNGTISNSAWPVQVAAPEATGHLEQIVAVAAGSSHSMALRDDGTAWTWGSNARGQLGNGTTSKSAIPLQVLGHAGTGHLENIVAIAAGSCHSLAVTEDGAVWAWGDNSCGQLGDGTSDNERHTPVRVKASGGIGYLQNVVAVAGGRNHSLALEAASLDALQRTP